MRILSKREKNSYKKMWLWFSEKQDDKEKKGKNTLMEKEAHGMCYIAQ